MAVTITSPAHEEAVVLSPDAGGLFTVSISGSNTDSGAPTTTVSIQAWWDDAEPDGLPWRSEEQVISGSTWTASFSNVPYASAYQISAKGASASEVTSVFSIRRPLQVIIPKAPGGEVPVAEGTGTVGSLEVLGLLGANAGDTVGVAIPRLLEEYASSPPEQLTGQYKAVASDYHSVREGRDYLLEVWLKADRPGSRLTIEWSAGGGYGTISPTGDPEDLMPGAPGDFIVNNLELPTEWTRFRAKVTWTFPPEWSYQMEMAVPGLFHFNQSTGSEQNAVQSIAGLRMVPYPGNEETWATEYPEIPGHPDAWIYLGTNRIPYAGDSTWLFPVEMETRYGGLPNASGSWSAASTRFPLRPNEDNRQPYQGFPRTFIRGPGLHELFAWIEEDDPHVIATSFTTEQFGFDVTPFSAEVKVLRGSGFFQGAPNDVAGFSVSEDAVPTNLVDLSGGISSMTFDVISNDDTEMLMHRPVSLEDPNFGLILGDVTGVEISENGIAAVTADSALRRLVRTTSLNPSSQETLAEYVRFLLEGSGFSEREIDTRAVPFERTTPRPGGTVDLWTRVKELLALHNLEITMVGEKVWVRPRYSVTYEGVRLPASIRDEEGLRRTITEGDAAREVSVTFHETKQVGDWTTNPPEVFSTGPLYPAGGWSEDVKILQVDAGETLEETLDLNASIFSVVQPECVVWVDRDEWWNSVYAVSGSDGLPIVPQRWIDAGGNLSVRRSDDTRSLIVTLTGANLPNLAPFQIAMSAGPSDRYSSLRLLGSGVVLEEKTLSIPTGVSENLVFSETAPNTNSELISSLEEAYTTAISAAKWHSGSTMEISGYEPDLWRWRLLEREGIGGLNLQSFGNMAGARFRAGRRVWRVQTVETSPEGSQFTAREDTTFGEFQDGLAMYRAQEPEVVGAPYAPEPFGGWKQQSFDDFNAEYAGMTFSDFTTRPLRRDDVPTPPELPNGWGNVVLNPSFEQSLANWEGALVERVRIQDFLPSTQGTPFEGTGDYAVLIPSRTSAVLSPRYQVAVEPGQWIGVRGSFMKMGNVLLGGTILGFRLTWYDSTGSPTPGPENLVHFSLDTPLALQEAWEVPGGATPAAFASLSIAYEQVQGTLLSREQFLADGIMLVVADSEEEALRRTSTYVDGDSPDSYERISYWGGGNSPSARENSNTIVRDLGE